MLRPEQMSKVSVTGAKAVMDPVVETVHEMQLLHVSEYAGSWEGFEPGSPMAGSSEASDKLVTVRSLESILDVDADDAGPTRQLTDDELEAELERVRTEVNELDDRRTEIADELRHVEERIENAEPFAALGIDLDLLSGYDHLEIAVGEGDAADIEAVLEDSDAVSAYELFTAEGDVVAVAAAPAAGSTADEPARSTADEPAGSTADEPSDEPTTETATEPSEGWLNEVLVGVAFQAYEIPDHDGSPADYVAELEHTQTRLENRLETVESELEDVKLDAASFLLAAEEKLSIEVQKTEAPLSFATTHRSFVAEGWIPSERYHDFKTELETTVDDRVEIEELERAEYTRHGHAGTHEPVEEDGEAGTGAGTPAATDGGATATTTSAGTESDAESDDDQQAVADGGVVTMGDEPPVQQDNPGVVKPFELLSGAVGRPNYSELDPTIVLWLTFPLMFGFMIGDVGYGLVYTGLGYYAYRRADSDAFRNFGIVAAYAGGATVLFGVLYGEIFGLHLVTQFLWEPLLGHPPIEKGLSPATTHWAEAWFVVTALFGIVHLLLGYVFEFIENNALHGFKEAMLETGSWIFALSGLWLFVFSRLFADSKPELLYTVFDQGEHAAFELGFTGLPPVVGWVGIGMVVVGLVLLALGPTYELIEAHTVLAHALSYLRIGAVLLAKAGMAFSVNMIFFGAYVTGGEHPGEFHFMFSHGPQYIAEHHPEADILFGGLMHGGIASLLFGVVVLIVGHVVVLLLGITSAGIQSIRLEYFEFFSKFYEGNGTPYTPFGYDRKYTAED